MILPFAHFFINSVLYGFLISCSLHRSIEVNISNWVKITNHLQLKIEDLTLIAVEYPLATLRMVFSSSHCPPFLMYLKILSDSDLGFVAVFSPPMIMKESALLMTGANLTAKGRLLPEI